MDDRRRQTKPNAGYRYRERIDGRAEGSTVIDWLSGRYRHSDRESWLARIAAGELSLDGAQPLPTQRLRLGQELVWSRPPWIEEAVPDDWEILHRDPSFLVVAKPSGLPTMPGGGFLENTLLEMVRSREPKAAAVHRLGRGTSGLVLFALDRGSGRAFSAAFRSRRISRKYLALVEGSPPWEELEIDSAIGLVDHAILGSIHASNPQGKPARSLARVVERRPASTLLEVAIESGRPHQIRIHLAAAGFPLLDDPLYLPGGAPRQEALPGALGYHLHAWKLAFHHPRTGAWVEFTAKPPERLRRQRDP